MSGLLARAHFGPLALARIGGSPKLGGKGGKWRRNSLRFLKTRRKMVVWTASPKRRQSAKGGRMRARVILYSTGVAQLREVDMANRKRFGAWMQLLPVQQLLHSNGS